jgi:hypothetical protein
VLDSSVGCILIGTNPFNLAVLSEIGTWEKLCFAKRQQRVEGPREFPEL